MDSVDRAFTEAMRAALADYLDRRRQREHGEAAPAPTARPTDAHWLTAEEACRYLKLPSTRALYQAIRRGTVPAHRMGRSLRFHRPELDRVLLSRATWSQTLR